MIREPHAFVKLKIGLSAVRAMAPPSLGGQPETLVEIIHTFLHAGVPVYAA